MSVSVEPAFQSIMARLVTSVPNVTILDGEDENQIEVYDGGFIKPYLIVNMSNPIRTSAGRGIGDSRNDTTLVSLVIGCVASTATKARELRDQVNSTLVDFEPTDSGRLTLDGGLQVTLPSTTILPKRYQAGAMFQFRHNMQFS